MGSATKIIVRPDGGITRRREPVTLELSALGRTAVRLRATAALNVHGDGGTVQRRNGCAIAYTGADPLAEVLWISFWQAWRNGGGVFPWGPLTLITEHDDVTVDTVDLDGGDWADGRMPERRSQWDPTASGQSAWAPGRWGRRSKRSTSLRFRIEDPAEGALGVVVTAPIVMQWTQHPKALKYRWQVTDADTGAELAWNYAPKTPVQPTATSTVAASIPADTLPTSRACKLKVWAILAQDKNGVPLTDQQADNVRTFYTKLSAPTNLAPVGSISTLTPTFTCDPVPKAVRYKVRIYDAAGEFLLHTSTALLVPSYTLGAGILTDYSTKKWTYTAYADTACTAAYGTESAQVAIHQIALDDTLADGAVGTAYAGTVIATGGTGPYTYAVTSGTLPAGLSLSSGGAVTGTPTTAATSAFTITATDANGSTGSRAYSVTVGVAFECSALLGAYNVTVSAKFWHSGTGCVGEPHNNYSYSGNIVNSPPYGYMNANGDIFGIYCDGAGWHAWVQDYSNWDGGECHAPAYFIKTSGNTAVGVYTPENCRDLAGCSALGSSLVIT